MEFGDRVVVNKLRRCEYDGEVVYVSRWESIEIAKFKDESSIGNNNVDDEIDKASPGEKVRVEKVEKVEKFNRKEVVEKLKRERNEK